MTFITLIDMATNHDVGEFKMLYLIFFDWNCEIQLWLPQPFCIQCIYSKSWDIFMIYSSWSWWFGCHERLFTFTSYDCDTHLQYLCGNDKLLQHWECDPMIQLVQRVWSLISDLGQYSWEKKWRLICSGAYSELQHVEQFSELNASLVSAVGSHAM